MTENNSFTKNIPHSNANVYVYFFQEKNGHRVRFMVEMRGFVAEGVIEERVSSLTKAKRQPWLDRGSATELRTTKLCKSPQK